MLNNLEQDKLQLILNDEVMLAALHKVFVSVSEEQRPRVNDNETNLVIGEKYRAYDMSKQIIAQAFTELERYKREEKQGENVNRAI